MAVSCSSVYWEFNVIDRPSLDICVTQMYILVYTMLDRNIGV